MPIISEYRAKQLFSPQPNVEHSKSMMEKTRGVALITPKTVDEGYELALAYAKQGISVEITLRNPIVGVAVLEKILKERKEDPLSVFNHVLVGVGSVSDSGLYNLIKDLKLDFIVTPGLTRDMCEDIIPRAHKSGVPVIPGVSSPHEARVARLTMGEGAIVKNFIVYWQTIGEYATGQKAPMQVHHQERFDRKVRLIQSRSDGWADSEDIATHGNLFNHLSNPNRRTRSFEVPFQQGPDLVRTIAEAGLYCLPTGGVKVAHAPELFALELPNGKKPVLAIGMSCKFSDGKMSPAPEAYHRAVEPYIIHR